MLDNNQIIRFSVSLPANLLQELDSKITQNAYQSRSELIRDLIREKLVDSKWEDKKNSNGFLGVLVLVYDHHKNGLNQRLNEIQHNAGVNIICNTHIHIDSNNCLETIVITGNKQDIESLSLEIGGLYGVKFCKLTRTASFDI
ncbi:nickel-responsive transcriptional regulator NikR [Helicobacter muridarum]|uniref:Putative nickel-responsive regulator n=1 Tax=Helicobacter muridarum TaxID=216 RepID=A0A099TWS4_9HELI|nr:nickel-responsive transcriptional regulator NikR [Helicobacter muridarum]TLE00645.1 nickel-responsive transcriptional regulator NikR [Helicobacter muridarum]STQ85664.1 Nickel responsive regulator [Helicobacter muridarum]